MPLAHTAVPICESRTSGGHLLRVSEMKSTGMASGIRAESRESDETPVR